MVKKTPMLFGAWISDTTKEDLGLTVPAAGQRDGSSLAERLAEAGAGARYAACMDEVKAPSVPQVAPETALKK